MPVINAPKVAGYGRQVSKSCRNNAIPDAFRLAALANDVNSIAARRLKVMFRKWIRPEDAVASAGATVTWRCRSHTSPNIANLRALMMLVPGDSTIAADPSYQWSIDVGGAGAVSQVERFVTSSSAAASSYGPSDITYETIDFTDTGLITGSPIGGDKQIDLSLTVNDGCRVVGCVVYEVTRQQLDTSTHLAVDPTVYAVGADILDNALTDITEAAWDVYTLQGTPHFSWAPDTGTAVTQTGTTWLNPLDGTTGAYSSADAGHWVWSGNRGRLVTSTVECIFWVYGDVDAGSGGRARLVSSAGTVATITGITTTDGFFQTTCTIPSGTASDLYVVQISDAGANQMRIRAYGLYEKSVL